jgi:hypothetical protein
MPGTHQPGHIYYDIIQSWIAPAHDPLGRDGNHRQPVYIHSAVLAVFAPEQAHRPTVFLAARENARLGKDQDISELAPIFAVAVDDERDLGIFTDVAQTLQPSGSLGLLVDGRIKVSPVEDKAYGNYVRLASAISGGKVGGAGPAE